MAIYVLIALEDGRVVECIVVESIDTALSIYEQLKQMHGGANCYLASRKRDDAPLLIHQNSQGDCELLSRRGIVSSANMLSNVRLTSPILSSLNIRNSVRYIPNFRKITVDILSEA